MKILVIEDNPRLADKIQTQLQKWFIIEVANSGDAGLQLLPKTEFDCVVLDLGLPDAPGSEICLRIRQMNPNIPILILTGVDTTESRVSLLDKGADDYVTKPFHPSELRARINALLRRRERSPNHSTLTVGDLVLNPSNRKVKRGDTPIYLRKKEFDILEYLMLNKGRVMSRQSIVNHAWTSTSPTWTGSVDVHIKQLRDKIDKPFDIPILRTSYGVGYMVDTPKRLTNQKGERQL